ncbi:MAG: acylphosphatase [Desulfobacteraceae bacterium]
MRELSTDQLKKILNTPYVEGTAEQIRLFAIRVTELCRLNGMGWVADNAGLLLDQWRLALSQMTRENRPHDAANGQIRQVNDMDEQARARVIISGRVQGVFFRVETQRAAERIGVKGWVRNQSDGTVAALFEGSKERVDQAIEWCWQGAPMSRVTDVSVQWETPTGQYDTFDITY